MPQPNQKLLEMGFPSNVFLAPMAGITDLPMRKVVRSFGPGMMVTEMAAVNALSRKNPKSYRIADVRSEPYPVVVQLVGGDEKLFPDAVKLMEELGAFSIDINMGCPVKKIVGNDSGCHLMKNPKQAEKIIKAAVGATSKMVSVKFRKGWDTTSVNAVDFAKMCEDSGAAYITLHGRTRSQFYAGQADWDIIAEVKNAVKIPVIGNGDIDSPIAAQKMLEHTKADGVMIGRAALGQPWIISQIHNYLHNRQEPQAITIDIVKNTLLTHLKELVEYYGAKAALPISRKYVCWYCKSLYDARHFREKYIQIKDYDEALQAIEDFFERLLK